MKASVPQLAAKHTILLDQIPTDIPLLAIQPPGEEHELQRDAGMSMTAEVYIASRKMVTIVHRSSCGNNGHAACPHGNQRRLSQGPPWPRRLRRYAPTAADQADVR